MRRVALAGLLACGLAAARAATVTACTDAAPEGFDIAQYETIGTNDAAGIPLYDQLTAFKPGTGEVVPGLAERWDVSADARQYTLHLRGGVKFHTTPWFKPTRDMNADDVLWSLQRINDKTHPGHRIAAGGYPYWAGMGMPELIKSIEKLDARTVRITLTRPEAPFLANLAMSSIASVYSAEYAQQLQAAGQLAQINTQPVGTGPFVFKSYQKDAVVRYEAHPAHWAGAPKLDKLVFAITPDAAVRAQRIKAGECTVGVVLAESVPSLQQGDKLAITTNTPLLTSFVALNTDHGVLGDRRFRQALWLAVDQPAFIRSAYSGKALPATSFLPPAMWSHEAAMKPRHDPEAARKLVVASGYDGRELKMFITAKAVEVRRGAQVLQADWERIGVKVTLVPMELGELYKRSGLGEHDLVLQSWYSDNGDPDNFLTPNLGCASKAGGSNKARWCHAPFDQLLDAARVTPKREERIDLYRRAQRMLAEEVPLIPLGHNTEHYAMQRGLQGFVTTSFGNLDFRAATLR